MPLVAWAPQAKFDLARLYVFLAPENEDVANRAVAAIKDALKVLKRHPEIGRHVPELLNGYRAFFIGFGQSGISLSTWQIQG